MPYLARLASSPPPFLLVSVFVFSFFGFLPTGAVSLTSTNASTFASSSSAKAPSSSPPTTSALFALSKTRSSLKPYLAWPSVSAQLIDGQFVWRDVFIRIFKEDVIVFVQYRFERACCIIGVIFGPTQIAVMILSVIGEEGSKICSGRTQIVQPRFRALSTSTPIWIRNHGFRVS